MAGLGLGGRDLAGKSQSCMVNRHFARACVEYWKGAVIVCLRRHIVCLSLTWWSVCGGRRLQLQWLPLATTQLPCSLGPRSVCRVHVLSYFKACMTEIYLHIDARMAEYIRTRP